MTMTLILDSDVFSLTCVQRVGDSGGPVILPGNSLMEDIQVGIVSWYE
jgi:secreted trypsin-like serine protease